MLAVLAVILYTCGAAALTMRIYLVPRWTECRIMACMICCSALLCHSWSWVIYIYIEAGAEAYPPCVECGACLLYAAVAVLAAFILRSAPELELKLTS